MPSTRHTSTPCSLTVAVAVLVLVTLASLSSLASGATYPAFTLVPTISPFTPRDGAFVFEWFGREWVVGGYGSIDSDGNTDYFSDAWSSYDLGRNWILTSYLPERCYGGQANAMTYHQSVYLTCSETGNPDTSTTLVSSDPQLATASWSYVSPSGNAATDDGLEGRKDFNVERMAVPFDGVGTLIVVNGLDGNAHAVNDVYWLSATGNFQPGVANPGTQWHQFTVGGAVYLAPWPARSLVNTVVDAEGLVLIMTSGYNSMAPLYSDVWQLSWLNGQTAPAVYQLTGAAGWSPRCVATMWQVHNTLFFYGGSNLQPGTPGNNFDDLYQSMDYGNSWYLITSSATGRGRNPASPLVVSRRFFIVGGATADGTDLNEVWEAYW